MRLPQYAAQGSRPVLLEPDPSNPTKFVPSSLEDFADSLEKKYRPTLRFMVGHAARWIALGFGSGLSRFAPGTVGTLWAWAAFVLLDPFLSDLAWFWVIVANFFLGWWACTVTAKHMRQPDSSHMVWDEVVAFWMVLWMVSPAGWQTQLLAFVVFRFFDAVKFGPMAWADQAFKGFGPRGGFGVMLDDIAAAFCTLLVVSVWKII